MAKKPADARRKLVEFDAQTWQALDLLGRDSMKTFRSLPTRRFATCCVNMSGRLISRRRCGKACGPRPRQVARHRGARVDGVARLQVAAACAAKR